MRGLDGSQRQRRRAGRAAALLLGLLAGCGPAGERADADLHQLLDDVIGAIEDKDPGAVLAPVSYRFEATGGLGYPDIEALALTFLLRDEPVGARLEDVRISPGTTADSRRVDATVWFVSGTRLRDRPGPVPESAVAYRVELVFELLGTRWQAVRGAYARIDAGARSDSGGPITRARAPRTSTSVSGAAAARRT